MKCIACNKEEYTEDGCCGWCGFSYSRDYINMRTISPVTRDDMLVRGNYYWWNASYEQMKISYDLRWKIDRKKYDIKGMILDFLREKGESDFKLRAFEYYYDKDPDTAYFSYTQTYPEMDEHLRKMVYQGKKEPDKLVDNSDDARNKKRTVLNGRFEMEDDKLVKYIGSAINVVIPDGVREIGERAFEDSKIVSIELPGSLTKIGYACFKGCKSLKKLSIPDNVAEIEEAFLEDACGCELEKSKLNRNFSIEYGILYNSDRSKILHASNKTTKTKLVIPRSVKRIGDGVFANSQYDEIVILPDSVAEIGERAFYRSSKLHTIYIPSCVTKIAHNAFTGCDMLVIHAHENSYSYEYAKKNNFRCKKM